MLHLFARKPAPPNSETVRQLESSLQLFVDHFFSAFNPIDNAISNGSQPSQEAFTESLLKMKMAREDLLNAYRQWPQGKRAFDELMCALDLGVSLIRNCEQWGALFQYPNDSLSEANMLRQREFVLRNRYLGPESDKHLHAGVSLLKDWTGLDMELMSPRHSGAVQSQEPQSRE